MEVILEEKKDFGSSCDIVEKQIRKLYGNYC